MKKLPVFSIDEFIESHDEQPFYANDLKIHLASHLFINQPHKHNTYVAVLFTKGEGTHQIDFNTYKVRPGELFLMNPGQVHNWTLSEDTSGFVFFHTEAFFNNIFIHKKIQDYPFFFLPNAYPSIHLKKTDLTKISSLFAEITSEFKAVDQFRLEKLQLLTGLVYTEIARLYNPGKTIEVNPSLLKARTLLGYIDKNYKSKKLPKEYADLMNITTRHLNRISQEAFKTSTNDLIIDRLILEAKRMLIHTDTPVAIIAEELGYYDPSYFVRLFKKRTGISPKQFQLGLKH